MTLPLCCQSLTVPPNFAGVDANEKGHVVVRLAEETAVLSVERAGTLVADLKCRDRRV
jgi:hypothetical protein